MTCEIVEAQAVMAEGFIGPRAYELYFKTDLSYGEEESSIVPYNVETLQKYRQTHLLIYLPQISIMDIWEKQPGLFYYHEKPWYSEEKFANLKQENGWWLVRKDPVPDSFSKTWFEQLELLEPDEIVPPATLLVHTLILHWMERGEKLFGEAYGRCRDLDLGGRRVRVGWFNDSGLHIDAGSNKYSHNSFGLASVLQPLSD